MTIRMLEWDNLTRSQRERDAMPGEILEIEARQKNAQKPQVPQSVTMLQARLTLISAGLFDSVNSYIQNLPGAEGDAARTMWEFADTVVRGDSLVQLLIKQLDLTETQLDQLFMDASRVALNDQGAFDSIPVSR